MKREVDEGPDTKLPQTLPAELLCGLSILMQGSTNPQLLRCLMVQNGRYHVYSLGPKPSFTKALIETWS